MPCNRQATGAVPSAKNFSSKLQHIGQRTPAEFASDDEDYKDNPSQPIPHDVSDTGVVAGTNSDCPPLVILNDPDKGLSSQKVKPTEDIAWFFEMDPANGT